MKAPKVQSTVASKTEAQPRTGYNDLCYICNLGGDLMECYADNGDRGIGCGKCVHIACIGRSKIPSGDWICSSCCAQEQNLPILKRQNPHYGYEFPHTDNVKTAANAEKTNAPAVNPNDICFVCLLGGDLIECYAQQDGKEIGCSKSAHPFCIGRSKVPEGDWICSGCAKAKSLPFSKKKNKNLDNYGYEFLLPDAWKQVTVGSRIAVYWEDDDEFYKGSVITHDGKSTVELFYDDGVEEKLDLRKEQIRIVRHARGKKTEKISNDIRAKQNAIPAAYNMKLQMRQPKSAQEQAQMASFNPKDIVCGAGISQAAWAKGLGWIEYRKLLDSRISEYKQGETEKRRQVCEAILQNLSRKQIQFVAWDEKDQIWAELSHYKSYNRIRQHFRDYSGPVTTAGSTKPTQQNDEDSENELIEGLGPDDLPLGRRMPKRISQRRGYHIFRHLIQKNTPLYDKSDSKKEACLMLYSQLQKHRILFMEEDATGQWKEVSKENTLARIKQRFQDRRSSKQQPNNRKEDKDSDGSRDSSRPRVCEHPLLVHEPQPSNKRIKPAVDPTFLIESGEGSSSSGGDGSQSEGSGTGSEDESIETSDSRNEIASGSVSTSLVELCTRIRTHSKLLEGRKISNHFLAASSSGDSSFNYYYQPPPPKRLRTSIQYDQIHDILCKSSPPPAQAHQPVSTQTYYQPHASSGGPSPPQAYQPVSTPTCYRSCASSQSVSRPVVTSHPVTANFSNSKVLLQSPSNTNINLGNSDGQFEDAVENLSLTQPECFGPTLYLNGSSTIPPFTPHARAVLGNDAQPAVRFRTHQIEIWCTRLEEAKKFRMQHGHCIIPNDYPPNQDLARWAKRQRYQYQLYKTNPRKSSITAERIRVLEHLGFCWEHKSGVWYTRFSELLTFKQTFGHTQVPGTYEGRKLASWVKLQRRQKKLKDQGLPNSLNEQRETLLTSIGLAWSFDMCASKAKRKNSGITAKVAKSAKSTLAKNKFDTSTLETNSKLKTLKYDNSEIGNEERKIREKYRLLPK